MPYPLFGGSKRFLIVLGIVGLVSNAKAEGVRHRMPAAARRSQLLEVALERFAIGGYRETSMDEIAETAGVTKPVLYQHFHSKEQLFQELLDSVGRDLIEDVTTRAAAEPDPYQRVLGGFRAYFDFVSNRTSAFQLLFGSGARLSETFADSVRRIEEQMAATIGRFVDADIDADHRDLLGHAVVGLGEVVARRWVARQPAAVAATPVFDPAEADRVAVQLADLVWAGLRGLPRTGPDQEPES